MLTKLLNRWALISCANDLLKTVRLSRPTRMAANNDGPGSISAYITRSSHVLLPCRSRSIPETWSVEDAQLHKAYSTRSNNAHPQVYPVAERMAAKLPGRTVRSFDVRCRSASSPMLA